MLGIRYVGLGECQSEDSFVCFGAKPTQKGLRARFPTRPEEDEERKGPGAEQKGISGSQGKVTVRERQLLKKDQRPVDQEARSPSARGRVIVPGYCVGISSGDTLAIATECREVRSYLFFFLPLSIIYVRSVAYL